MAPPTGLEPVTPWLTVRCSTDWAKEEYVELVQFQAPLFVGFYWDCSRAIRSTSSTDWAKEKYARKGNLFSFLFQRCRLWTIFPGRLQPSIFATTALNFRVRYGNGWTHCVWITDSDSMIIESLFFCVSVELFSQAVSSQVFSPPQRLTSVFGMGTGGPTAFITLTNRFLGLVHLRGLEPRTHWLRVSCSTSWAKGASRRVPSEQTTVCP